MPVLKLDDAEIHYQEFGSGYPLVLFAPGGMRSRMEMWWAANAPNGSPKPWNNWTEVLASQYRVIAMDQRNAGASKGGIEADHGWHTYAADHLALLDHLGIGRCNVLGVCIGPSFCMKLLETAPDRINALVLQNPVGLHPEFPTYFQDGFVEWADDLCNARPELDRAAVQSFGDNMWNHDFVYSVDRDFVRNIDLPAIVMPGNDTPHPAVIGIEVADILPGAERLMDWKGPDYGEPQRHKVVEFLAHHTPN
ncbi:MAG: alpha/beta hydrolase [Rhodospirillales bacterium]|jgi:pimeloyl-ACP methyl ester carboxylesterase|nr:alpha/beta hydrolase [Rhodospirillaceae bacterium]MBT6220226.1 alpha/beta hydrolase [Rhodospirillaceae bacterium]MBT6363480.1 alpha/beta hydrolase [Rhodospirillaceae bacterium]MBT8005365.1 alpha/beta hydrolase [Rhodospirillales bacterium]